MNAVVSPRELTVLRLNRAHTDSVVLLMHENSRNTIAPACVCKRGGEGGRGASLLYAD